jgi:hypothetical protein
MDITQVYRVAISGKANTGKNTIFNSIKTNIEHAKYNSNLLDEQLSTYLTCFKKLEIVLYQAFADPIKEMVMAMFNKANQECLYGASKLRNEIIPGTKLTYRQVLINLGKLGRDYDFDHWIKEYDNRLSNRLQTVQEKTMIICTDLRYRNEFDYLKKNNYYLIRVKRDSDSSSIINDSSETSQDEINDKEFDAIIDNNSSFNNLENKILSIVLDILEQQ